MRVAFIGLGRMGRAMAANVVRGDHDVVLFNRTRTTAEALATEIGASVAASAREAAEGADVVVTMLADADALFEVYSGDDGAAAGLQPGAVVVDMGTTGPDGVARLGEMVRGAGATLVDAPVSGSTSAAAAGSLTIMAGGSQEAIERVRPVLETMGSLIYHLGDTGAGATMKLATNAVLFALGQAISEALVLAEHAGVDRERAYEVFENSAVAAPMVRYRHDLFVHPESAEVAFPMTLVQKDLQLIHDFAEAVGAPMPQADVNLESYGRAIEAGFGDEDLAALAGYLRTQGT